ncbi:MAG: carboxypeptidase-like regulatory domain-containing protein, partial [Planctomycetes bacterium]|nr:carboxypeptidase-like regulatory domain-containing protein [Planctomycetota bacterium]
MAQAITDELGYFEAVVPIAIPFDIEAIADHHATARRDFIFAGEEVLLKLPAAALLEGVIQRALDDSPVVHALVIGMNHKRMEIFRSHTNLDGQFISENLEPGLVTVEVTPQDAIAPPSQKVDLQAGLRTHLEFTVENGFRIHGMVIDQQGLPIAGAEVGLGASLERSTLTDINGWYEMIGVGDAKRRGLEHLVARAEGYGKERRVIAKIKFEKDMRLDFALTLAR